MTSKCFFTFICRTVRYLKYLPYSTLFEIFAVQDAIWNICRTVRYFKYARHKSRNLGFQRNGEIVSQKFRIFAKRINAKLLEKAKFFSIFAKLSHIFLTKICIVLTKYERKFSRNLAFFDQSFRSLETLLETK